MDGVSKAQPAINGWHRIFVVIAVATFAPALLVPLAEVGRVGQIDPWVRYQWESPVCKSVVTLPLGFKFSDIEATHRRTPPRFEGIPLELDPTVACRELGWALDRLAERPSSYEKFESLERSRQRGAVLNDVGNVLSAWAIFVAALYGIGWSIAWIIRGFRKAE